MKIATQIGALRLILDSAVRAHIYRGAVASNLDCPTYFEAVFSIFYQAPRFQSELVCLHLFIYHLYVSLYIHICIYLYQVVLE